LLPVTILPAFLKTEQVIILVSHNADFSGGIQDDPQILMKKVSHYQSY